MRNLARAWEVNSNRPHCREGHDFDAANTYTRPDGRRDCKVCRRQRRRESAAFKLGMMSVDRNHLDHGTFRGYSVGCRCGRCRYAASDHKAARKAAKAF